MKKRLLICVIAVEPNYERTAEVLRGIITQAFHTGCDIAVLSCIYHQGEHVNDFRKREQSIFELLRSDRFDGFLFDSRFLYNPALAAQLDRLLQSTGEYDLKTSSWIATPQDIRSLGGALFCERRYNTVFVFHNGADSYYGVRGWRGVVRV
jgi:hypothetical protein